MIPILYEANETAFASNGLGRLRDCISCTVSEERNSIYEADFEYPVTGANFDKIKIGRIIGVTHDESGDIQPFDIVSCERPINGVVSFHCVHISYRQRFMTVSGTNINSLADAFTALGQSIPPNPFKYGTDKTSAGYVAAFDGTPRSVRSILGGVEGSILDAYGGEYVWDKWAVKLLASRGQKRNLTIRYGVNMTDYTEGIDYSSTYVSAIPFWKSSEGVVVKGNKVKSGLTPYNGVESVVPLDLTDKFETQPTAEQLETMAASYMSSNQTYLPAQSIKVNFVRIQDSSEYQKFAPLLKCSLCDEIKVEMPLYKTSGTFKIVKTVWDVLNDRFESMELGKLSVTLSQALGINSGKSDNLPSASADKVVEYGTNYRKWESGIAECWVKTTQNVAFASYGSLYLGAWTWTFPITFASAPVVTCSEFKWGTGAAWGLVGGSSATNAILRGIDVVSRASGSTVISAYAIGRWK